MTDVTGNVLISLKYWQTAYGRLEQKPDGSFESYYNLTDHLGSTRVIVRQDGHVLSGYDYYPFGSLMPGRDSQGDDRPKQLFTGKERDEETGFDYFGARYYSSEIGRWLGVDPMEEFFSGYLYVGNNPLNRTDPNGMFSCGRERNFVSDEMEAHARANMCGSVEEVLGGGDDLGNPTPQEIYDEVKRLVAEAGYTGEFAGKVTNLFMSIVLKESSTKGQFVPSDYDYGRGEVYAKKIQELKDTLDTIARFSNTPKSHYYLHLTRDHKIFPLLNVNKGTIVSFDIGLLQINSQYTKIAQEEKGWLKNSIGGTRDLFRLATDWEYNLQIGFELFNSALGFARAKGFDEENTAILTYIEYNGGITQSQKFLNGMKDFDSYNNAKVVYQYYQNKTWRRWLNLE